jgi:prefoldin subunit 5
MSKKLEKEIEELKKRIEELEEALEKIKSLPYNSDSVLSAFEIARHALAKEST